LTKFFCLPYYETDSQFHFGGGGVQLSKKWFPFKFLLLMALGLFWGCNVWADEVHEIVSLKNWGERVRIFGALEVDYYRSERSDIANKDSDGTSDLFVSTAELGANVAFSNKVSGNILLLGEDIGTEDETSVSIDEAFITISSESSTFFLIAGKRALPFGVFDNHLLNDPITQDAYETSQAGATIGLNGPRQLELSITAYKGEEMMDHFFDSELFEADDTSSSFVARQTGDKTNDVDSFIYAASISALEETLKVFCSYLSEPGRDGARNQTISAGINLQVGNVTLDGEYMEAITREKYNINGTVSDHDYKEKAFAVDLAYQIGFHERSVVGGALFAERQAHTLSEPLELGLRFEKFDDAGLYKAARSWSVDKRWSAGARYAFYEDLESDIVSYVAAEYRHTDFNVHDSQPDRAKENNEYLVRLGVSF